MIKPRKLQPGDTVAAISLSWGGPGTFPHRYEAGKAQLQDEFGLKVVETAHALSDAEWLRRNPKARAEDLMTAFADSSIKAIISTIGGDDSIRILPYLDLDVMRTNPKIFLGFSDTTITHLACFKAGLVSFYGPSIMAGFAENGGMFPFTANAVRSALFSSAPIGDLKPNTSGWTVEMLDWGNLENQSRKRKLNPSTEWKYLQGKGMWQGHLIGGCLEVLDFLRGTDFWPESSAWQDAILFLETSEEAPPPGLLKSILRSYASIGILRNLSGILFGRPGGNISPEQFKEYDEVLYQVVTEEEGLSDLPIISRMDFGHTDPMFVLPYGVKAEINCETQQIRILESAVVD
ncbi:MAG TPA: S66 peptidase family protein [Anaerolineales bacterium]|nr:S66 peptidase family protein [Anaerolineales bacterium]